jgi:hypothetical protein
MERFARNAGAFFNNLRQDIDAEFVRTAAPPPASAIVRRQLPRITIAADDLIESCNRECAICTDAIQVGDVMTRLPCAHLYHPDCIDDWFQRSCLCPVCRYELPTDDPNFEAGRMDRMRHRKPRFAQYEVNRMSVAELKTLARGRGNGRAIPRTINDKPSLIEYLVEQDCIELVRNSTVEQVKYRLSELRSYNIKRLRDVMNNAGVFYDRKEVVEKADMIRIFIASGRLLVLPEPQAEPPEVETVHSDDEEEGDVRIHVVLPSSTPRRHVNQVMEEASFAERGGYHERQEDDNGEDDDDEMEVDEPRPPRRDADGTRFRRDDDDENISRIAPPPPASANGNRPRAAPHPLPTAPVERSLSSSLIETMMEQVATLDTPELTMLHETICQLLEDRNNSNDPPSSSSSSVGRRGRYEF